MILRIVLFIGIVVCLYSCYLQTGFLINYINESNNSYRHEYLAGAFLVSMLSSIAWIGTPILAIVKKNKFKLIERVTAYIASTIVTLGLLFTVALDFVL